VDEASVVEVVEEVVVLTLGAADDATSSDTLATG
jgi:hypothetical protein